VDIDLAHTFLAVIENGNFITAAEQLHISQTAVSARIRALEQILGRRLFVRNKAGARLTPAGERFRRDAALLVQTWERARQRIALPPGRANVISVGADFRLWNPLLTNWLIRMREQHEDLALHAEVDAPARLLEKVQSGALDLAVVYDSPPQSGLIVELLTEEQLVMVTTSKGGIPDPENYVHVDWGQAFTSSHQNAFPHLASAVVSISHGPLALGYLLRVGGSGYFRRSVVRDYIEDNRLWLVNDAPLFSYSVHAVHSTRSEAGMIDRARANLRACLDAG
jgi:DNA-binding transcriptional LysR family regulator